VSYDLMVFDPAAAPAGHAEFMKWYEDQTKWQEPHGYDDPAVSTPGLRALVLDLVVQFPALNGPLAPRELPEDESAPADYSIGSQVVYAAFAWSKAEEAYSVLRNLAEKHGVGFFDVSGPDEEVWLPSNGRIALAHSKRSQATHGVLQVEGRSSILDPTDEQIATALRGLNSTNPSFAILELPDKSYVQCAGAANRLTVEWRTYSGSNFKHFVGGKRTNAARGMFSRGTTAIQTSATRVLVRNDQVLTQEDALAVFVAFWHGQPLTGLLRWTDVTSKFA